MKHRDTTDPIAWARRINSIWKVRNGLNQTAAAWIDHLNEVDPARLRSCCAIAAVLARGPGYGADPKPWFYGGLFSLATLDEANRFLAKHRLTSAVIPALAHDPRSEQWTTILSEATRGLITRLRNAVEQEVARQEAAGPAREAAG